VNAEAAARNSPDTPESGRPGSFGRTAAWLAKQVEIALATVDLSLPQYRVLGLLDAGPAVSSALADRLAVRPSSVTAIVDGLVARGLVDRRAVVDDRRRVSHVLTSEGGQVLAAADTAVEGRLADIARSLADPSQATRAIDDLGLWQQAFRDYHAAVAAR
jgi:long-chain acyl-CoA synthetase